MAFTTRYHTATVRDHEIFYRAAGDPANPTVVLLHGFPASSFMYRELIAELSDSYHLIAPDHLGFGRSATPSVEEFDYTFDALAAVTSELLDQLGVDRFALYVQDYGAPIGFRIASQQPARITALISQNGNAYLDGITPFWEPLLAYAADGVTNAEPVRASLEPAGRSGCTRTACRPIGWTGCRRTTGRWTRPGSTAPATRRSSWRCSGTTGSTSSCTRSSRSTSASTSHRRSRSGATHDEIFGPDGARAFARDLPDAEIHLLDAGHFALESSGDEIADLVRSFLRRVL